jgi:hypothetical protein
MTVINDGFHRGKLAPKFTQTKAAAPNSLRVHDASTTFL